MQEDAGRTVGMGYYGVITQEVIQLIEQAERFLTRKKWSSSGSAGSEKPLYILDN
jgi:hypothetical protein